MSFQSALLNYTTLFSPFFTLHISYIYDYYQKDCNRELIVVPSATVQLTISIYLGVESKALHGKGWIVLFNVSWHWQVRQTIIGTGKYVIGISALQFSISSIRYGLIKSLQLLIKMTLNSDLMISFRLCGVYSNSYEWLT